MDRLKIILRLGVALFETLNGNLVVGFSAFCGQGSHNEAEFRALRDALLLLQSNKLETHLLV